MNGVTPYRMIKDDPLKKPTTLQILEALTEAVEEKYRDDPTSAGLVIAKLHPSTAIHFNPRLSGCYWVSIVRYTGKFGEGKILVVGQKGSVLKTALREVANAWLLMVDEKDTPIGRLRACLDK